MLKIQALRSALRLGIELPDFFARFRIERNHAMRGGREIERAVCYHRSTLESGDQALGNRHVRSAGLAHVVGPGSLQRSDVAGVDLLQRGEAGSARISAGVLPLLAGSTEA